MIFLFRNIRFITSLTGFKNIVCVSVQSLDKSYSIDIYSEQCKGAILIVKVVCEEK